MAISDAEVKRIGNAYFGKLMLDAKMRQKVDAFADPHHERDHDRHHEQLRELLNADEDLRGREDITIEDAARIHKYVSQHIEWIEKPFRRYTGEHAEEIADGVCKYICPPKK